MDSLAPERVVLVDLLFRTAENHVRGRADVQDLTRGNCGGPYDVRERGDDAAQPLAKRPEFSFRLAAGGSLPPLSQCPLAGGPETPELRLPHVVGGRPRLHRPRKLL